MYPMYVTLCTGVIVRGHPRRAERALPLPTCTTNTGGEVARNRPLGGGPNCKQAKP
jgi:hypothetical protein